VLAGKHERDEDEGEASVEAHLPELTATAEGPADVGRAVGVRGGGPGRYQLQQVSA
jgi:hypothetical protein